jgi:hypothetical protein
MIRAPAHYLLNHMASVHKLGNLDILAPDNWVDVTNAIKEDHPPFTLAREDGVGVIQFSAAEYQKGKTPNVSSDDLKNLLQGFAQTHELSQARDFFCQCAPFLTSAASFNFENRFLRVWYCSDGKSIVLVTYNCQDGQQKNELFDCESIVHNLKFTPGNGR